MKSQNYKSITKKSYNSVSRAYAERDMLNTAPETKEVIAALNNFVRMLPRGAKVLDVGCGAGRDSRFLSKKGLDLVGVDFSRKMIEESKKLNRKIKYRIMDLENLRFEKEKFDGIWANASLHHIPKSHLKKVINQFHKILKKNGGLFIKVKYGNREWIRKNVKFGRLLKRYFAFYKPRELAAIVKSAGFKVLNIYTTTQREWVDVFARK